jgi:hypothetical protein
VPKKLTQEQALAKIVLRHGDLYDLSLVDYTLNKNTVKLICKEHGEFDIVYRDLVSPPPDTGGCQKCSRILWDNWKRLQEENSATSTEDAEIRLMNCNKHDYIFDMSTYKRFSQPMIAICKVHGEFQIYPTRYCNTDKGFCGCPTCGNEYNRSCPTERIVSKQERLEQVERLFGCNIDASSAPSDGHSKTMFTALCTKHNHSFRTNWNLLTRSEHPCTVCSRENGAVGGGFSSAKQGYLYILIDSDVTKVGITNCASNRRLKEINCDSGLNFNTVRKYEMRGQDCIAIERYLLNYLANRHNRISYKFCGSTECFIGVDIPSLIKVAEDRIKEI